MLLEDDLPYALLSSNIGYNFEALCHEVIEEAKPGLERQVDSLSLP